MRHLRLKPAEWAVPRPPIAELDQALPYYEDDVRELRGAHVFITGGTGFVGKWLLETLLHAIDRLSFDIRVSVLTRNPSEFFTNIPWLSTHRSLQVFEGDVRRLPQGLPRFDGIIHAATPASAALVKNAPREMLDIIIDGTRNVLDLAGQSGAIPVLLASSGAVYGPLIAGAMAFGEDERCGPDQLDVRNVYHESKRISEMECAVAAFNSPVRPKIARMFAFVGPYLPLDAHFAIGNFIRDAVLGKSISVRGDGTAVRSYLYASDMACWLWRILVRGEPLRPYNVGSDRAISIGRLAEMIAGAVVPPRLVVVEGHAEPRGPVDRYVPKVDRAMNELGLRSTVPLEDAIARTVSYAQSKLGR